MVPFTILQLTAIALAADARGPITTHYSPVEIVATPAGDRDGECASLRLSMTSASRSVVHSFCRSARVYDMKYGVIIINDNVNISDLTVYYARKGKIVKAGYRINAAGQGKLDASSLVIRRGNRNVFKTDVTFSFSGKGTIGPRTLGYRCVTVDRVGLRDTAGKCR